VVVTSDGWLVVEAAGVVATSDGWLVVEAAGVVVTSDERLVGGDPVDAASKATSSARIIIQAGQYEQNTLQPFSNAENGLPHPSKLQILTSGDEGLAGLPSWARWLVS
jgi:hypothetical protein